MSNTSHDGQSDVTASSSLVEVTVPPRFCDAQGMVHASRYHEFLEDAFLQWLKENGLPYASLRERGLDLVIGTTTIRYLLPGRLGDKLEVSARPAESTTSTVTVGFTIARDSSVLAEGATTYIAVRAGRTAPLPDELRDAMERSARPSNRTLLR